MEPRHKAIRKAGTLLRKVSLACCWLSLPAAAQQEGADRTPARGARTPGTFTTAEPMVHDPVMAEQGGTYYLMSTGRGIQVAESSDRKTWRVWRGVPLVTTVPAWTHDSVPGFRDHIWAPDIIRYRGRWWLNYSCSTFGKNTSAIGLLSTDSLRPLSADGTNTIRWRDEGAIVCSKGGRDNWNAIDGNFVIDDRGNPWLTFGSFWDGIQLVRLDSTMHIARPSNQRTIARRRTGGRDNPIEAPFLFRHGAYYYLFVSWDYCCRGSQSTYKVAVGRSHKIDGPYLDRNGKDMAEGGGTVVLEGDKKVFEAAGHCAVYHFADRDIFICHGYSINRGGASVLIERPVTWTQDGWPDLSPGQTRTLASQ